MPFLDRMVRRAAGTEPLLRLRPRSRFEPDPGPVAPPPGTWPSVLAPAVADVAPVSPARDQRQVAAPPAAPTGVAVPSAHGVSAARRAGTAAVDSEPLAAARPPRTAQPLAAAVTAAPETAPLRRIRRDPVTSHPAGDPTTATVAETLAPSPAAAPSPVEAVAPQTPTAQPRRGTTPADDPASGPADPAAIPLDTGQPPAPVPVTSQQPRERIDPEVLIHDHVVPVLIDRGVLSPTESVTVGPRRKAGAARGRGTRLSPGTTSVRGGDGTTGAGATAVHVHIDRVEVQRQIPPTPRPSPPPARRTPGADLDAYLARRKERR